MNSVIVAIVLWVGCFVVGFTMRGLGPRSRSVSGGLARYGRRYWLAWAALMTMGSLAGAAYAVYWFRHLHGVDYKGDPGEEVALYSTIGASATLWLAGWCWASWVAWRRSPPLAGESPPTGIGDE